MEYREVNALAGQEHVLSDSDLKYIKRTLGKSHQSGKVRDDIKELLKDKQLFTIQPVDDKQSSRFCFEGILQDNGVLLAFTSLYECEEYGNRHAAVRMGKNYNICTLSCEKVLDIADAYGKDVYIDVSQRPDDSFLVYDGKVRFLYLCVVQKI